MRLIPVLANADVHHKRHLECCRLAHALAYRLARAVQRILQRYAQDAGLEELTPHICRHTFAKNLVNNGVSLEKVAALLGHANLNTTRLYITPDKRDLEFAVEKLSQS